MVRMVELRSNHNEVYKREEGELTDFSYTLKLQADLTGGTGDMDIDAVRPAKNT